MKFQRSLMTALLGASAVAASSASFGADKKEKPAAEKPDSRKKLANFARIDRIAASVASANETLVDVSVSGVTAPLLSQRGKQVILTLPGAALSPSIASNLVSAGLISRIGVETSPAPARDSRITFDLDREAVCTLAPSPSKGGLRVRLVAEAAEKSQEAIVHESNGYYDIEAYQTDLASLLTSLAKSSGASVAMLGASPKVTAQLKNVTFEMAVSTLSLSSGLGFRKDGAAFVVGTPKQLDAAFPTPVAPVTTPTYKTAQYSCRYVVAADLAKSIQGLFDGQKDHIRISTGAGKLAPTLTSAADTTGSVTGVTASPLSSGTGGATGGVSTGAASSNGSTQGTATINPDSRELIFYGETELVDRAMASAKSLDVRPKQVRFNVRITDVNSDALIETGIRWSWSTFSATEKASTDSASSGSTDATASTAPLVNGIGFGSWGHTPFSVTAQLSALEQANRAKLLAAPNLAVLDGQRGFIQIGQRILYPVVVSLTQSNSPLYSVQEVRVGVYMQLAVHFEDNDEISVTLYPQVSSITGYLNVNGGSYPQVSTREAQSTLRLKNGQAIVVGGLIRDEEITQKQAVPFLSKIPFFGELFKYRKTTHAKSEVVIVIEPEIIN